MFALFKQKSDKCKKKSYDSTWVRQKVFMMEKTSTKLQQFSFDWKQIQKYSLFIFKIIQLLKYFMNTNCFDDKQCVSKNSKFELIELKENSWNKYSSIQNQRQILSIECSTMYRIFFSSIYFVSLHLYILTLGQKVMFIYIRFQIHSSSENMRKN